MGLFENLFFLRTFQRHYVTSKGNNGVGSHSHIVPQEVISVILSFLALENLRKVEMIWFDGHTLTTEVGLNGVKRDWDIE